MTSKNAIAQSSSVPNDDPPPAFSRPPDAFSEPCLMIDVVVGDPDDLYTFTIHEPLLEASSAYFEKALSKPNHDTIQLEDVSERTFGYVNNYIYTSAIFSDGEEPTQDTFYDLCEVWLLAHRLQMLELVNYAMWSLVKLLDLVRHKKSSGTQAKVTSLPLSSYYTKAPPGSKLLDFLLDIMAWYWEIFPKPRGGLSNDYNEMGWNLYHAMLKKENTKEKGEICPLLNASNYYIAREDLPALEDENDSSQTTTRSAPTPEPPQQPSNHSTSHPYTTTTTPDNDSTSSNDDNPIPTPTSLTPSPTPSPQPPTICSRCQQPLTHTLCDLPAFTGTFEFRTKSKV